MLKLGKPTTLKRLNRARRGDALELPVRKYAPAEVKSYVMDKQDIEKMLVEQYGYVEPIKSSLAQRQVWRDECRARRAMA
jgi:hypothetical protein